MVARTQQETGKMTGRIREKASREEDEKKHLQHSHEAGKRTQPEYEARTAEARRMGQARRETGERPGARFEEAQLRPIGRANPKKNLSAAYARSEPLQHSKRQRQLQARITHIKA